MKTVEHECIFRFMLIRRKFFTDRHVYSSNWSYCFTIYKSCLAYKWMKIYTDTLTFGASPSQLADLIVRHINFRFGTMKGNDGKRFSDITRYKLFCAGQSTHTLVIQHIGCPCHDVIMKQLFHVLKLCLHICIYIYLNASEYDNNSSFFTLFSGL